MIEKVMGDTLNLCGIPSPTGYTEEAALYIENRLSESSVPFLRTVKGSVLAELGGTGNPLILSAHIDTLGAMVRSVKANGRLRITKIGSYPESNLTGVNCLIHSRLSGKKYSGTFQATEPAVHVNSKLGDEKRDDTNIELVIDEKVLGCDDIERLQIRPGDFISIDSGTVKTDSGFIKSRHLDDKAGAALLLNLAETLDSAKLNRKVYLFFSNYEETGHGSAAALPEDAEEILAIDMGAVGDDLGTNEYKVSICAKDSSGPYNNEVTTKLVKIAEELDLNYAVDIYPFYTSDASAALRAGANLRHGLIGPGVSASHGYERVHKEGLTETFRLIEAYITAS